MNRRGFLGSLAASAWAACTGDVWAKAEPWKPPRWRSYTLVMGPVDQRYWAAKMGKAMVDLEFAAPFTGPVDLDIFTTKAVLKDLERLLEDG